MKHPFEWDDYSDQPKIIFDKEYKRRMRARYWPDYLKMVATSALVLPATMAHMALTPEGPRQKDIRDLLGMGVNLNKGPQQVDFIDELQIQHVLIRVPLWDMERLSAYQTFAQEFQRRGKTVLINVLQDREHIENPALLANDLFRIFDYLAPISHEFQVGNAINRVKWGFFAVEEYLKFYQTVQKVRDQHFPAIELLGPAVIDFEYHFTARAAFNGYNIKFDRLSALLYVDRMGAPENKQYGLFDTDRKMSLLGNLAILSPKVKRRGIYVTEVNWPLQGMGAYAPTSPKECVSMQDYCEYMQRYLEIAMRNNEVSRVYWHQLIAPGYGLVSNLSSTLEKTKAFYALKQLLRFN